MKVWYNDFSAQMNSHSIIWLTGIPFRENDKHWHACLNLDYRSSEAEDRIGGLLKQLCPWALHHSTSTSNQSGRATAELPPLLDLKPCRHQQSVRFYIIDPAAFQCITWHSVRGHLCLLSKRQLETVALAGNFWRRFPGDLFKASLLLRMGFSLRRLITNALRLWIYCKAIVMQLDVWSRWEIQGPPSPV